MQDLTIRLVEGTASAARKYFTTVSYYGIRLACVKQAFTFYYVCDLSMTTQSVTFREGVIRSLGRLSFFLFWVSKTQPNH